MVMKGYNFKLTIVDEETKKDVVETLLTTRWSKELKEDLNSLFSLDIKKEFVSLIIDEIKRCITEETIEKLLEKIEENKNE